MVPPGSETTHVWHDQGGGGLSFLFNGLSNSYTYVSRKMHLRRKSALRERLDKNKWRENKGGMGRERKTPLL